MKKYLLFFLCSILILSGCGPVQQQDAPTIPASPPTVAAEAQQRPGDTELCAVSVPATSEVFQADDGTQLYTYTAQHMQLILPNEDVADKIVLDFLNRVDACSLDAQNLLETTDYTVAEIAAIVGYDNSLYFSRIYHKQKGQAPSDYRKRMKEQ